MVTHYIYEEPDKRCLLQGDVLQREVTFCSVLQQFFPYYAGHKDYRYFLVLTQSCDLVRRNGKSPSAKHITIAAVLSVEDVIKREATPYQEWWQAVTSVLSDEAFNELKMLTERLLDNNVDGYFYLHEDATLGLSGRNCASLTRSVAVRPDHYDVCCGAKIAQLKESFRAKLGWLVGNIYSRVGTSEWNEHYGKNAVGNEASRLLKDLFEVIGKEKIAQGISELQKKGPLKQLPPDQIYQAVQRKKVKAAHTRLGEVVRDIFNESRLVDQVASRAIKALTEDQGFREEVRSVLAKHEATDPDSALSEIRDCVVHAIQSVVSDGVLPGRDKLIARLSASVSQDPRVRSLLR